MAAMTGRLDGATFCCSVLRHCPDDQARAPVDLAESIRETFSHENPPRNFRGPWRSVLLESQPFAVSFDAIAGIHSRVSLGTILGNVIGGVASRGVLC